MKTTRRDFILGAGGVTLAFSLQDVFGAESPAQAPLRAGDDGMAWVRIHADGGVTIFNPVTEMGQGSLTALPMILAEEMDAAWEKVRIEDAPLDPATYGFDFNGKFSMLTAGAWSVRRYYTRLRLVGAKIRWLLRHNAATRWGVELESTTTEPGMVLHPASKRSLSFAQLASGFVIPKTVPELTEKDLKPRAAFRLIGKSLPRRDVPGKTDGTAPYSIDVALPGMLYAVVARAPVHDDVAVKVDDAAAKARPGVLTVPLKHGVAVVASGFEAALSARELLRIEWAKKAPAAGFDSVKALEEYKKTLANPGTSPVTSVVTKGDVAAGFSTAKKTLRFEFFADYAYHAQMEPLNAVARYDATARKIEVWAGTQDPATLRADVAAAVELPVENVTVHRTLLGGGFGRRSMSDFGVEAALVAKAVQRPVKLIWTRADDVKYGAFRPMAMIAIEAGLAGDGGVLAWRHTTVGDGPHLQSSGIDVPHYAIPHQDIKQLTTAHGVRLKHWRSVGHNANKFAIECAVDELAAAAGKDPYRFRRDLLRDTPRGAAVLDRVAKLCDWSRKRPAGRGLGIAYVDRSFSYGAAVAEVSVDTASGRVAVHKIWLAIDAGVIIHPDNARAQLEGGVAYGIGSAFTERLTVKDGMVEQSGFADYPIARMTDMPEVEIAFIDSDESPTGIGESSTPLVAPAVANAIAAATGVRMRQLPMTAERVKAQLGA